MDNPSEVGQSVSGQSGSEQIVILTSTRPTAVDFLMDLEGFEDLDRLDYIINVRDYIGFG